MTRESSLHKETASFVRYHLGRAAFAAFTGTDTPAWHAWVYLLQLYGREPGDPALDALRATLALAQPKEAVLMPFVQAIAAVLDWGYVEKIWPRVCGRMDRLPDDATGYTAVERDRPGGQIIRRWG